MPLVRSLTLGRRRRSQMGVARNCYGSVVWVLLLMVVVLCVLWCVVVVVVVVVEVVVLRHVPLYVVWYPMSLP